jgi:hypothetical protein
MSQEMRAALTAYATAKLTEQRANASLKGGGGGPEAGPAYRQAAGELARQRANVEHVVMRLTGVPLEVISTVLRGPASSRDSADYLRIAAGTSAV